MKIRLFVNVPLKAGQDVAVTVQAHYLVSVMRRSVGDQLWLFNGTDGEWLAEITHANKRNATLRCIEQSAAQKNPPDLWLLFAPIKKARTDFIVEKAAEMGAARILPVQTQYTNSDRVRTDRLQAHAVEAAEQCGGTFVPEVADLAKLTTVLNSWPPDRKLLFCDETMGAEPILKVLSGETEGPWAILIGPEGGFSVAEAEALRDMPETVSVTLGPRILRADTAAVAAMTAWQVALGDW